ncbi:hypothetical protein J5N97_014526 [Dioscorea zingiberensis]|uniref:Uncharacterized protein n=1 Tax=Dioscorea zingiberensis TaxID=325984 RepID=A0A9D5HK57_9LILI|nr:hypothetical protein J5N97_014526 [Dioscorea zingiberensis]
MANWTKVELLLEAKGTNVNSRLQLTTTRKSVIWFDQVSLMPLDTYKVLNCRVFDTLRYMVRNCIELNFECISQASPTPNRDTVFEYNLNRGMVFGRNLVPMLANLKPRFIRFPAEGEWLRNAFRWKKPWVHGKKRPVILVMFGASSLNCEASEWSARMHLTVCSSLLGVKPTRSGVLLEHLWDIEPFELKYVALGNQDCWKKNYEVYTSGNDMFAKAHQFDRTARLSTGPKAFVSEYAATGQNVGTGNLFSALAQAGFLIGLEINSDVVEMASNAPLFVNDNDRR